MNEALGFENDPSALLTLASSIARRTVQEARWQQTVMGETMPVGPLPPIEIAESIQIGATVSMLQSLEHPEAPIDPLSVSREVLDNAAIENFLRSQNSEADEQTVGFLRAMIDGQIKTIHEHFASDRNEQQNQKEMLDVAAQVAEKHAVAVHKVFDDDELYAEYMRTRFTPQSMMQRMSEAADVMNQDMIRTTVENMADSLTNALIASGEVLPEEYEEVKSELLGDVLNDPSQIAELEANLSVAKYAMQRCAVKCIERYWDSDTAGSTIGFLGQIATKDPELTDGLRDRQAYNDIVIAHCMEQGWDPNNLTIDQMSAINASQEVVDWRNKS